ncbi:hypothetical protein [Billgrantia gudaonensis]|uniref:Uncharacterized protein n=1 Tax=Billgrantia gudaonensis TaxID=376427 RepID=A0A1G8R3S1_9GAMM|nr:hypothetical protein [Halomonas gudaonensis]SDJ11619.1 hypothetical protein SAMN04487954_10387 [Halomonas gudaonensis]
MTDKILAGVALLGLLAFLITVPIFVPHVDLILFTLGCLSLAAYDFWRELFSRR